MNTHPISDDHACTERSINRSIDDYVQGRQVVQLAQRLWKPPHQAAISEVDLGHGAIGVTLDALGRAAKVRSTQQARVWYHVAGGGRWGGGVILQLAGESGEDGLQGLTFCRSADIRS